MAEKTAAYESELGTATAVEEENKKKKLDEYGSCEELEQIHASRLVIIINICYLELVFLSKWRAISFKVYNRTFFYIISFFSTLYSSLYS